MYEDHLKTCSYCQNQNQKQKGASSLTSKPTIYIKTIDGRPSISKQKKPGELGAIIRGTSYPSLEPMFQTKGASSEVARKPGPIEREVKLKELGKIIRGE
jgi:hypothetical protein